MRIVITGTSGVGKTYLEQLLAAEYGFFQLPKTTSRDKRPQEIEGQGIKFASKTEINNNLKDFFFCLNYAGNIYCWENKDLQAHKDCTMAITMESLTDLIKLDLKFIPILLYLDQSHLDLLDKRIRKQLDYDKLNQKERIQADLKIKERLQLASKELAQIAKYIEIVNAANYGRSFLIKDDDTLYQEVIPYILSLQKIIT